MSEQKVSLWDKWKVQFAFVAGALVVSSVWGTCSYTPSVPVADGETVGVAPAVTTDGDGATKEVSVSSTSEGTTDVTATTETVTESVTTTPVTTTPTTVVPATTTVVPATTTVTPATTK
jgi:hypothetical protein